MATPPDDGPCEVTITAPDREWLQAFVRQLVKDRLAAAGHVDTMHTTYRWAGEILEAEEARAILHTRSRVVPSIRFRLRYEHDFEIACLVVTAIIDGSIEYLQWIDDSVVPAT